MPKPSPRAKRVWDRLQDWYGTRLTEQYGPTPPDDWCELIDRTDNDTVKRGLSLIRAEYLQFPPTFPQFEKALQPVVKAVVPKGPNVAEKLSVFVVKHRRLTERQLGMPWTYIGKSFPAAEPTGKMKEDHGIEITGVVIPADGDHPGYRVMVEDMQLVDAA